MESRETQLVERHYLRPVWRLASWFFVRKLATLQILNRASILMLIAVPIIAAVWPVAPYFSAAVDGTLAKAERVLDKALAGLNASSAGEDAAVSIEVRRQISKSIADQVSNLDRARAKSVHHMPATFALLFFASLAIVLARMVFQVRCPHDVQEHSKKSYAQAAVKDFLDFPSENHLQLALRKLEWSTPFSGPHPSVDEVKKHVDLRDVLVKEVEFARINLEGSEQFLQGAIGAERLKFETEVADKQRSLTRAKEELRDYDARESTLRGSLVKKQCDVIAMSAENRYIASAYDASESAITCSLLYCVAICMLSVVVFKQSRDVATAAGWL